MEKDDYTKKPETTRIIEMEKDFLSDAPEIQYEKNAKHFLPCKEKEACKIPYNEKTSICEAKKAAVFIPVPQERPEELIGLDDPESDRNGYEFYHFGANFVVKKFKPATSYGCSGIAEGPSFRELR